MTFPSKDRVIKIVLADDDVILSKSMLDFLNERGIVTRHVRTAAEAESLIFSWDPDFVLYDLMLPGKNALAFLKDLRGKIALNTSARVIVLAKQNNQSNTRECMRLGAADVLPKPIGNLELLSRLVLHLQTKHEVREFHAHSSADLDSANYYMHLTELTMREALKGAPAEESLHNLTGMMSVSLKAVRVSVIQANAGDRRGLVFASNDKRSIKRLPIDLAKYPELVYVLNNEKLLAVDNLAADQTMHFVTRLSKSIIFNAMIVAPIRVNNHAWGVLSVRLPDSKKKLTDFEIRYVQLIANVAALVIQADTVLAKETSAASDIQSDVQEEADELRKSA